MQSATMTSHLKPIRSAPLTAQRPALRLSQGTWGGGGGTTPASRTRCPFLFGSARGRISLLLPGYCPKPAPVALADK